MLSRRFGGPCAQRSVLVLASGTAGLENCLPNFGQKTFVDRSFPRSWRSGNCRYLRSDVEAALLKLAREGRRFDTIVILNEGLREDLGAYSLHRQATLGLLSLVVRDQYTHVASPEYYWAIGEQRWSRMLDVPFAREEIEWGDLDFIDPRSFASAIRRENIHQWRMSRVDVRTVGQIERQSFHLRWQSLWCDHESLDLVVIPESFRCRAGGQIERFAKKPVVCVSRYGSVPSGFRNLQVYSSMDKLAAFCAANGFWRIGFMPDPFEQATQIVECFARRAESISGERTADPSKSPFELRFYHLRQDDYDDLYAIAHRHVMNH